jgi:uncharacterized protein (TIGR03086 family)
MVGATDYLLAAMAGQPPTPPRRGVGIDEYERGISQVLAVLEQPEILSRECPSPLGFPWSVEQAVAGTFMDQLVHTWDLATATGQDATLDSDLVVRCMEMFLPHMPEMGRSAGLIGPAVEIPADSSPQDRLLGALGRQP